ncbi:hypothetical protein D3C75_894170 [compost metagenome]
MEQYLEDDGDGYDAGDVRDEVNHLEQVLEEDFLVNEHRQHQGQGQGDGHHQHQDQVVLQGFHEDIVLEQPEEIIQSDELGFGEAGDEVPVGEA